MMMSCLHHHAGPDPAEQTLRVVHHIKINVLAQGLFSVSPLFVVDCQLACVCVCARSPGVTFVIHGCAHLFNTGDASPLPPQDGWGG